MNGTSEFKVSTSKAKAGLAGAHAWKMGGWIQVDFDETMTIQC